MDNHFYQSNRYTFLAKFALIIALATILLGTYTRLSDAGQSCPDWPTCYAQSILPSGSQALQHAQRQFPNTPLETNKAWKTMFHRYSAALLGIIIFFLSAWALMRKGRFASQPLLVPILLLGLVFFEIFLGKWSSGAHLMPIIVLLHTVASVFIASLLYWLILRAQTRALPLTYALKTLRPWALLGLLLLAVQFTLGAWTSANYATLACPDFPQCFGSLWPAMHWHQAFHPATLFGPNYEGGLLAIPARITIQMTYRYGTLLTAAFLLPFSLMIIVGQKFHAIRLNGCCILFLLLTQIVLGALAIHLKLIIYIAMLHNFASILLLLSFVTLFHRLFPNQRYNQTWARL